MDLQAASGLLPLRRTTRPAAILAHEYGSVNDFFSEM